MTHLLILYSFLMLYLLPFYHYFYYNTIFIGVVLVGGGETYIQIPNTIHIYIINNEDIDLNLV